jgi:hypothetical protein
MTGRRGNTIIYAIFLTVLASAIAYLLFAKSEALLENLSFQRYDLKLSRNLSAKADLVLKWENTLNSDGGYFPARTCPGAVTMSGTAAGSVNEIISTVPAVENGQMICSGTTIAGTNLRLYYSSDFTTFLTGTYVNSVNINPTGTGTFLGGTFSDPEAKVLSFTLPAGFSDYNGKVNSDDYRVYSTGTVLYPNGAANNDVLARKTVFGFVRQGAGWTEAFWTNAKTNAVIDANANNADPINVRPSTTATGYLYFDIDQPHSIRVVEFDSGSYLASQTLKKISTQDRTNTAGAVGFLQNDLSFSGSHAAGDNAKVFDFQNRNYAIFLSYSGTTASGTTSYLKYRITGQNEAGSGMYLQPIDDSMAGNVRFYANDIIIDPSGNYRAKTQDFFVPKTTSNPAGFGGWCSWTWGGALDGACFSFQ